MNAILFNIVLASKPWIYGIFQSLRRTAIGGSSKVVGIALIFGSLVVVFKLIKLAYALMSDEQSSGFGQVDVKVVLRPFFILMLIQAFPTVVGMFDGFVNSVSMSLVTGFDYEAQNIDLGKFVDVTEEFEEATTSEEFLLKAMNEGKLLDVNTAANQIELQRNWEAFRSQIPEGVEYSSEKNFFGVSEEQMEYNKWSRTEEGRAAMKQNRSDVDKIKSAGRTYAKARNKLDKPMSWISIGLSWAFEQFYYIVEAFAEVFLCILALLGPIACVLALFDVTRDAHKQFFLKYAQVSLWKVIAGVIMWVIANARSSTFGYIKESAGQAVQALLDNPATMIDVSSAASGVLINAVVCVAGMICLANVPSMAGAIIPASSFGSAMGGAEGMVGGAIAKAKGMVKGVAGGAGKAIGTAAGIK